MFLESRYTHILVLETACSKHTWPATQIVRQFVNILLQLEEQEVSGGVTTPPYRYWLRVSYKGCAARVGCV